MSVADNPIHSAQSPIDGKNIDFGAAVIQADIRRLERHDLWVWGNTIIVILGLTALVVALSISLFRKDIVALYGLNISTAVRMLVVLVLGFTVHAGHQLHMVRNLQRELGEKQIQAEVFRRLAMFDPLTGLYNRRFAEQRLSSEIARSERKGHSLTIVLLDLNDFKKINDTFGHSTGDRVLKEFGERLNRSIRGADLAVRWGGDEFMLVLVECNLQQLQHVLIRLQPFEVKTEKRSIPVSFAIGWREYQHGDKIFDLLEGADLCLYRSKQALKAAPQPVPEEVRA
jgi:diguanylate cyclase (GGDEF)-like protein